LISTKPQALDEYARTEHPHAQWPWQRRISDWILDRLTGYGVLTSRLLVVTLLLVGLGIWAPSSNRALAQVDAPASSPTPGGTLSASSASAEKPVSYERARELLPEGEPAGPLNIAHRGGAKIGPENTLVGFQNGLSAGAEVLELDVHLTKDGELVVIHNNTVDDTTNETGLVREMTLQQLKQLDAGYDFSYDDDKSHPYRGKGVVVPTMGEVYRAYPDVPLNVEIKETQDGIELKLWRAIEAAGAEDHTLVVAKKTSVIRRFREVSGGQVATGASAPEMVTFIICSHLYPSCPLRHSYQALQVWKGVGTSGLIQAAHRAGIRVDVWTVDEEKDMRRFIDYGVDGIMSDRPDILNGVLQGDGKGG
jgi:glycerophosphoryl diester phosphodiesterase